MSETIIACNLCTKNIENKYERVLIEGREFAVISEIESLPFRVVRTSRYICRACSQKLKKRRTLINNLDAIETYFKSLAAVPSISSPLKRSSFDNTLTPQVTKKVCEEEVIPSCSQPCARDISPSTKTSSPIRSAVTPIWPISPIVFKQKEHNIVSNQPVGTAKVDVFVRVKWPSKEIERKLPEDFESLAKMLIRGTYKQIANAAWKNVKLRKEFEKIMEKEINKECTQLCSKKEPSCLRLTSKENMLLFTMEKFSSELEERAPLFHSLLVAASFNPRSRAKTPQNEFAAVAMAGAVCLRNRSKYLIAVQLLISIFLYHSSWLTTLARLSTLKLATSHTYLYKKLEEFGKDHDKDILDKVALQGHYMARKRSESELNVASSKDNVEPDSGRKITFDNIDYHQDVHYMTEQHQNIDKHYVTYMCTENRVSGNSLSEQLPPGGVMGMENGKCLPSTTDNVKQRLNYIHLVEQVITTNIPCLKFLSDVCTKHIPHKYSAEMKNRSETVFLGMIYENENDADGIIKILQKLHKFVPCDENNEEPVYGNQGVVGDQLTVERAINGHMSLSNGFTAEERVEGLHFEVADWHAGNKFLEIAFNNLYSVSSVADKCTMFCDRNLINRRNVKSDVTAAANACRRFFTIEVESRIIAGTLSVLEMTSLDEEKVIFPNGEMASKEENKRFLRKTATCVVDKFVIDQERNEKILEAVQVIHQYTEARQQAANIEGRYPCRYQGCPKTFAHDGKVRREHESQHNPPPQVDDPELSNLICDLQIDEQNRDDMFAYQKALLDYGMLLLNFWDAISKGDGERVIRCWKFFLMYLKHQGKSSNKYALEALYLMFQTYALLSPRDSHRLIWNRFIKNKSGESANIPLDLDLEFKNKIIKEAIKKLGPSANQKSLDRIGQSLGVTNDLMHVFDSNLDVFRRSGKHVKKSTKGDLMKVVKELVGQQAFCHTPGRKYTFYRNIKPSILNGLNLHKVFQWIDQHKKYMILSRHAR